MKLLRELYAIHSESGHEKKMRKYIRKWINTNVADVDIVTDASGNLLVTKGVAEDYPCIVAHMDQVQDKHEGDFHSYIMDGKIFGFSASAMKMRGLGADDKNGIWVALKCLEKYPVMKCAFFVGEEIGCVGSEKVDMDFFDDCRWVVQCDRKGSSDLITVAGGTVLCSDEFLVAIGKERFGYQEEHGLMTDVMTLKDRGLKVSCVNMSCGYYRPHTDEEYTKLDDLENCLAFVEWIVENVKDIYPHEYDAVKDWGGYAFGYGSEYGSFYADYYGKDKWKDWYLSDDELADEVCEYLTWQPGATDEEVYEEMHWYTERPKSEVMQLIRACRAELALIEAEAREA